MNKTSFLASVWIEISTENQSKSMTCALVDTGSEITLSKRFLFGNWTAVSKISKITGINGYTSDLKYEALNQGIIMGSKIITVKQIYQYEDLDFDILLGNSFLQQFQYYKQDLYKIQLKTPCGHLLQVNRTHKPYRVPY